MTRSDRERLIGVLDLSHGRTVRANGGPRLCYPATEHARSFDDHIHFIGGDPLKLVDFYRSIGLGGIYFADLDALSSENAVLQKRLIEQLLSRLDGKTTCYLDAAVDLLNSHERLWLCELANEHDNLQIVLATECASDDRAFRELFDQMSRQQITLSLDYKHGHWISAGTTEDAWLEACDELQPNAVIALDTGWVGGSNHSGTLELAARMQRSLPRDIRLISGGGVRGWQAVHELLNVGVDSVLVASWFTDVGSPFGSSD